MPDWNLKFKPEYDYARGWLRDAGFDASWLPLVRELAQLMTDGGFEPAHAEALTRLRVRGRQGAGGRLVTRDVGLLSALDGAGPTLTSEQRMRVAALKMLSHVYLLNSAGNRQIWLHNLPDDFKQWATDAINACGNDDDVKKLLRSANERFGFDARKHFAVAPQQAMAWCQKTSITLATAKAVGASPARDAARDVVKRWFAEPGLPEPDLDGFIETLSDGFKNITAAINAGHIVLTDWAPLRGATTQEDLGWLGVKAFTFAGRGEGLDVVYIEEGFFKQSALDVFSGQKHYTRIFVHELTHLVAGTDDVDRGGLRYAFNGCGPHAGYPGADCIRNADNWACFAADCAGVMTPGELAKARKNIPRP